MSDTVEKSCGTCRWLKPTVTKFGECQYSIADAELLRIRCELPSCYFVEGTIRTAYRRTMNVSWGNECVRWEPRAKDATTAVVKPTPDRVVCRVCGTEIDPVCSQCGDKLFEEYMAECLALQTNVVSRPAKMGRCYERPDFHIEPDEADSEPPKGSEIEP